MAMFFIMSLKNRVNAHLELQADFCRRKCVTEGCAALVTHFLNENEDMTTTGYG